MFWRQLEFGEFDVSEMSLSALARLVADGKSDWVALPVFTLRRFYHTQLLVRADAGIQTPADLRGKRAGVPDYIQTSVVWARGVLADEYGVQPSDLTWVMEREADRSLGGALGFVPPADLRFSFLAPDKSLDRMLLDGELDVLFHYITARNLVDRSRADLHADSRVRTLYPDVAGGSDPLSRGDRHVSRESYGRGAPLGARALSVGGAQHRRCVQCGNGTRAAPLGRWARSLYRGRNRREGCARYRCSAIRGRIACAGRAKNWTRSCVTCTNSTSRAGASMPRNCSRRRHSRSKRWTPDIWGWGIGWLGLGIGRTRHRAALGSNLASSLIAWDFGGLGGGNY